MRPPPPAVVRAVQRLSAALQRAGAALQPPQARFLEVSGGVAAIALMRAAVRTRLAEPLAPGPRTASQVAAELGLNRPVVHRVLRGLAVYGLVRLDGRGRFTLTRTGRLLLEDDPHSMAGWVRYATSDAVLAGWLRLPETLADGLPAFNAATGTSMWDYMAAHPDEEAGFARTMRELTLLAAPLIVAAYPWPEYGTVCDVGGGVGAMLAEVLRARPALDGVLVDQAGPLAAAREYLAGRGVAGRVRMVQGDLFTGFDAAADIYLLKDVLHDWDDGQCQQILRSVHAAAPLGSRVLVLEWLQEPNVASFPVSISDVMMLAQTEGRQRSAAELQGLGSAAGFRPGRTIDSGAYGIVELIAA
ncbi:methyltransferase [Sinomonas cellulolyticus]|uniref:Helix-turn-helix domain-containing protein n=1 Tax=Sinomonas cellulolyticus TaxID=2801916 RepID=A0ABS1JZL9_9MICC|nr:MULTISPECIES: methyltransferase [Sinomonas]MBL0704658.1 helix-turn-helix domain-containing protein [Sinomonas cellulolyticus]GHG46246.1 methyltransferase [Sinomonas sp. KCTC 49339]